MIFVQNYSKITISVNIFSIFAYYLALFPIAEAVEPQLPELCGSRDFSEARLGRAAGPRRQVGLRRGVGPRRRIGLRREATAAQWRRSAIGQSLSGGCDWVAASQLPSRAARFTAAMIRSISSSVLYGARPIRTRPPTLSSFQTFIMISMA